MNAPSINRRADLSAAIARLGVPKYKVAAAADMAPSWLRAIETGKVDPSPEQMSRLAHVLDVSIESIFGGDR